MNGAHQIYSFGEFTLDVERGALRKAGADVKLRPKSFAVLRLLVERAGRLVSKDELLEAVWGRAVVTDGVVTQCLIDVRHALGDQSQQMIRTVPRRGYIFDVPVSESWHARSSGMPAPPGGAGLRTLWTRRNAVALLLVVAALAAASWSLVTLQTNEAAAQRSSKAPRNSIAVLPFVDLSPEQDQEFLSDGISEEILNLLAQAPDLQVIARTSSFSFKGRNADIAEIAARLHVAHVLEGSVRKSGSHLRITAQLVDGANSAHMWSQTYERELQDAFAVQSDIAARVSEALKVVLTDKGIGRTVPSASAEAHEHFLRAQFFYNRRAPGDVARAKDHYEQALRIDPRYARAWEGLAGVYGVQISTGAISRESGLKKRLEALEQALALDPDMVEAHVRAANHYFETGDRQRGEEHLGIARALDRDNPVVLSEIAQRLAWDGHFDEAVEGLRRVVILDPVSPVQRGVFAGYLLAAGRYDEARAETLKELELNPAAKPEIDVVLGHILILQHRFSEARALIQRWPQGDDHDQGLALVEHALGRHAAAEAALQRLAKETHPGAAVRLAEIYAQRGEVEQAFRWMEAARARLGPDVWLSAQWRWAWLLRFSPFLRPLRDDPRWDAMSAMWPPEQGADEAAVAQTPQAL